MSEGYQKRITLVDLAEIRDTIAAAPNSRSEPRQGDMPGNYGVPTTMAIYSPTGVKIADNWADLLDGTIDASLANGVLGTGADFSRWWSGSLEDGSIMQTCNGWTDQSGGTDGNRANTDATWIFQGGWIGSEDWGIVGICWP